MPINAMAMCQTTFFIIDSDAAICFFLSFLFPICSQKKYRDMLEARLQFTATQSFWSVFIRVCLETCIGKNDCRLMN